MPAIALFIGSAFRKSFFRELPPELVAFAGQPFEELVKEQTGLDGKIVQDSDALTVAKKIDQGTIQFGVFQGHEFAWVQEKYPTMIPLVCSVYRPKEISAVLLVRADCKAKDLGDLKDKKVAIATTLKDYARLFLNKQHDEHLSGSELRTASVDTVHDGIFKVIDGSVAVTVSDSASWNYFQKLYPGAAKNVRVLAQSDEFPPTVIVYKKGAMPDDVLNRVSKGFLTAHKNHKASIIMAAIRIDRFDKLPAGYDNALKACRKAYPKPLAEK